MVESLIKAYFLVVKPFVYPKKNLTFKLTDCDVYYSAHSPIAQLVEQRTVNPWVVGSSPTRGANTQT